MRAMFESQRPNRQASSNRTSYRDALVIPLLVVWIITASFLALPLALAVSVFEEAWLSVMLLGSCLLATLGFVLVASLAKLLRRFDGRPQFRRERWLLGGLLLSPFLLWWGNGVAVSAVALLFLVWLASRTPAVFTNVDAYSRLPYVVLGTCWLGAYFWAGMELVSYWK